jgi:hypothetical protein
VRGELNLRVGVSQDMNADNLTSANERSLANLARILATHCRRLSADVREEIIDALVECGFDDSDDPRGCLESLATNERDRFDARIERDAKLAEQAMLRTGRNRGIDDE